LARGGLPRGHRFVTPIIADDFIGSSSTDTAKQYDIVPDHSGPVVSLCTLGETNVRVFGDTSVLMGVINTAGGPEPRQIRVTLVCQKRHRVADDRCADDACAVIMWPNGGQILRSRMNHPHQPESCRSHRRRSRNRHHPGHTIRLATPSAPQRAGASLPLPQSLP